LNLTGFPATPEQALEGVVEPVELAAIQAANTFLYLPTAPVLRDRARFLALYAKNSGYRSALIGGEDFFMPFLEGALLDVRVRPLYSFCSREIREQVRMDGSVRRTVVKVHKGFVGIDHPEQ